VAKVMISLPDDLLARIDERARRYGTTRSGLLRELAEQELRSGSAARRRTIHRLLSTAGEHGGRSAAEVRKQRRAR
jgi:metal-responsive CopG/Arc/MetJ family transcriptional regulator